MTKYFTISSERVEEISKHTPYTQAWVREFCTADWANADEHQTWLDTASADEIAAWIEEPPYTD